MSKPSLVIAGLSSGAGKTTVVLALTVALRRRGLKVATFKCGPDYLDPTYHERASGRTCHNLDSWMMGREALISTFNRGSADADIALVEGVMGVFDGLTPDSNAGSTAEVAQWLDAPVLLAVDASGMARTFAALVKGVAHFDANLKLRGAIANFVGSQGHLRLLRSALAEFSLPGGLPKSPELSFPERHLGLHPAWEGSLATSQLEQWGDLCEQWFDLDKILSISREVSTQVSPSVVALPAKKTRCRIGLARDEAFHFYYDENLRLLEMAGAELIPFSPIHGARLPDVDGIYIGGGYPELHAEALADNYAMKQALADFAKANKPIYAECGGFMYLADELITKDGRSHRMTGLISGQVQMRERLQALGYAEVTTERDTLLGPAGTRFRGHQFRYSEFSPAGAIEMGYRLRKRRGQETSQEGYCARNVLASYVHGHWASHPQIAEAFVSACEKSACR